MDQDPSQAQVIAVDFWQMHHSRSTWMIRRAFFIASLLCAMIGCGNGTNENKDAIDPDVGTAGVPARLTIICTTPVLSEIATRLMGDDADVYCLLKPGDRIDKLALHAADVVAMHEAKIIIVHGQGLDDHLIATFEATAPNAMLVRAAGDAKLVPVDPITARHEMIDRVHVALIQASPNDRHAIDSRANALVQETIEFSVWVQEQAVAPQLSKHCIITNDAMTRQFLHTMSLRVEMSSLDADDVLTQADEDRLLVLTKQSMPALLMINPRDNEVVAEMIQRVARATGARIVPPMKHDWQGSGMGYVQFMKENIAALASDIAKALK